MPPLTLLQLEPETRLDFCKSQITSPSRTLKLTSTHSGHVAYKVKTTAPKAYLVRPSSGTLRPHGSQEVQIILQPAGISDGPCNHRFLVQAVAVATDKPLSREEFQAFAPDQVQEARLNVVIQDEKEDSTGSKPAETGTGQKGASATLAASGGAAQTPEDLKAKYDEAVRHALQLEETNKKMEEEAKSRPAAKAGTKAGGGYSTVHLVAMAVLGVGLAYAARQFET